MLALYGWARPAVASGLPANISLTPGAAIVEVGQEQVYTATLYDSVFNETTVEPGSSVGFAVDASSVAVVAIDTSNPLLVHVTGVGVGATVVRAFYVRNGQQTNVFTSANVAVEAASCPYTTCGAACVDTTSDPQNCGACGHACTAAQTCTNGACSAPATCAQIACAGVCTNVLSDVQNCGACGHACTADQICSYGACSAPATCAQTVCAGVCTDLENDMQSCGACGHACDSGDSCADGTCVHSTGCGGERVPCGEFCALLDSDPANCGGCGITCSDDESCDGGHCESILKGCSASVLPGAAGAPLTGTLAVAALGALIVARRRRRRA